jgi:hypothetical protein
MSESDNRLAAKRWRRRNADQIDTFERERSAAQPSFERDEYPLPMTESQRLTDREEPEGVAIRHEHIWAVENPDA